MTVGDRVMLTGDNFQIPNVGMKGQVTKISPGGWVHIEWDDQTDGWFSPYQAQRWICKVTDKAPA
jgi:hypothetical protein